MTALRQGALSSTGTGLRLQSASTDTGLGLGRAGPQESLREQSVGRKA